MSRVTKFEKKLLLLVLVCFCVCPLQTIAATVEAEGQALITSNISLQEYKDRAIANALQNIINDEWQSLSSFSIVENGKMLFDQIQSSSKARILSYEIINEYQKKNIYYVKIEAVLDKNLTSLEEKTCRDTQIPQVDFSISLTGNKLKFPAWFSLNKNFIESELKKQKFSHALNFISETKDTIDQENLYRLFKPDDTSNAKNKYELQLNLSFNILKNNYVLLKNDDLELSIQGAIFRSGKTFGIHSSKKTFGISKKFGINLPLSTGRNLWDKNKKELVDALNHDIQSFLDTLKCITIEPELKQNGSIAYINFGKIDGIKKDDIFVIKNDSPQKLYFKVAKISDHQSELQLLSKSEKTTDLIGKTLTLVEGL